MTSLRPTQPTRTSPRRRGVALVSVVSVLVLLMIVATPFLLSMRDSARRGERFLYVSRAEAEAESLFVRAQAHLAANLEHVERRALDALGTSGSASGTSRPPDHATPTSDTLAELQLPAAVLKEFNQISGREHRVWDLELYDAQAKFNLNSCGPGVLANLLGRTELTDDVRANDDRIAVADASVLPAENGAVRIGEETVRYKTADRRMNMLLECKRSGGREHSKGTRVLNEAAFEIATRPYRVRPGAWVRYTNVYEARTISELGVTALRPTEFDRMRRFVTAWSGNVVGDGWCNPQTVRNNIAAGSSTLYAEVKNVAYFGFGTIVRITDGVNEDFAVVTDVTGANRVSLAGDVKHDYLPDQTRIYSMARAAINVNTADAETLAYCFWGVGMQGKTTVSQKQAWALATFLKQWKNTTSKDEKDPEVGVFRSWADFGAALDEARSSQNLLTDDEHEAILRNAVNACDARLQFSTVPFCFRSFDVYEARATAAMLGPQGQEIARREMRRTFDVSSSRSSTFVLESQADFQEQVRSSRDAKWYVTYPANVNAFYDGRNIPASEYRAFAQQSRYPETDRSSTSGHFQLLEAAFRSTGQNRTDRVMHFDEEPTPEGIDLEDKQLDVSIDAPYSTKERKVALERFVQIPDRADQTSAGLAPFACSFWYKPKWDTDATEHVIFDYGLDEPAMNRVYLRYDAANGRKSLVLGCADATREQTVCEVDYDFNSNQVLWDPERWYHIACTVYGCSPEMMELFVDGEKVGRTPLMTRLAASVAPTGDISQLPVEDATGFPQDGGVLLVRGSRGVELMEYSQCSQTAFTISRRRARTFDHVLNVASETPLPHEAGDVVELYGFSSPLLTDVRRGGATLPSNLGPWRIFRARGEDTGDYQIGTPGTTIQWTGGIAYAQGHQNNVFLTEWTTGNPGDSQTLDDLGPQGARGIAVLASIEFNTDANGDRMNVTPAGGSAGTNDETVGGIDVVLYEVGARDNTNGLTVRLVQRGLTLRHWDASTWVSGTNGGRFFPSYDFGGDNPHRNPAILLESPPAGSGQPLLSASGTTGTITAFIPIGIVASGGAADYLDPADSEPQLGRTDPAGFTPGAAYVQIDSEWIKYDTFDDQLVSGSVAFYRDLQIDEIAQAFGAPGSIAASQLTQVVGTPSGGVGGGSGGNSSNNPPPFAQDGNDESNAPPTPTAGTAIDNTDAPPTYGNVDFSMLNLATRVDFRSWEDRNAQQLHRIANTIAANHSNGAALVPCFALVGGHDWDLSVAGRPTAPGFNDLVTLRDLNGADEQIRVQWGYAAPSIGPSQLENRGRCWLAPTQATLQQWRWDRPMELSTLRRYPSSCFTRAMKFPSREMPDSLLTANVEKIRFGRRMDDAGGTTPAVVDELVFAELQFPADDLRDYAYLGQVPPQLYTGTSGGTGGPGGGSSTTALQFVGIDEQTDTIQVFLPHWDEATRGLVVAGVPIADEVFRLDGGILRIEEELILYSEFDAATGTFSGCVRGRFGTVAQSHAYGVTVFPVETYPATRLTAGADENSASFQLADATDFPDDGILRIADDQELILYTDLDPATGRASMPLGRIDEASDPGTKSPSNDQDKRTGGPLFRGRYATVTSGYAEGDVAIAMPFRYYDRDALRADDPEMAYTQFTWTKTGAIWKRITWDEQPVKNVDVVARVRFAGGPAWDSGDEKVIRLPDEQTKIPREGRADYLYEITDPSAENLLNVESDRVEVRFCVRYAKGAYDRVATPRPNEWKESPQVRKVVVEYVAPSQVLSQE